MSTLFQALWSIMILVGILCLGLVARSIWRRERHAASRRILALVAGVGSLSVGILGFEQGVVPLEAGMIASVLIAAATLAHAWSSSRRHDRSM